MVIGLTWGGLYRRHVVEEVHAYSAQLMHLLQTSVSTDSYSTYLQFSRGVRALPPVYLRDVLEFNYAAEPISIEEVEAITEIRKRFVTPGLALGVLSPEAQETNSLDLNRHRPQTSG